MVEATVRVEDIRFLSSSVFVLDFKAPTVAATAEAGQFMMVSVGDAIDPLLRRPMAFYRILRREGKVYGFSILVEKTGRGTTLLAAARPGDRLSVLGPLGQPFRFAPAGDRSEEHFLVMGGVGAAPFPMLARAMIDRGLKLRAFVGGRDRDHLLCVDDFERLGIPVHMSTDDGSRGHHGLVTEVLEQHIDRDGCAGPVYSCGPTPMMRAVDAIARRHGVAHQVSLEAPMACGLGVCLSCVVRVGEADSWSYRRICREGPVFDAAVLLWD